MYSGFELLWLFFVTSFLGWILETSTAAIKQKRFVNRGAVNAPFCVLYGFTSVFLTVFFQELDGIWLFIASLIITTLFEWVAGHMIEVIYHERWWDYSEIKWNLDGYICLPMSLLWGVLSFIMIKWGNRLIFGLFDLMPGILGKMIVWVLLSLLIIDVLATILVSSGKLSNSDKWHKIDEWLDKHTAKFSDRIYKGINKRLTKAYPKSKPVISPKEKSNVFAVGCSFHKIIWLFVIGAFLGDIVETIYCRLYGGVWMSRSSVVWGPFSIVWGLAIAAATLLLYKYRDKSDGFLFLIGTFLGGVYEYFCSVFTELVFGKVFWDYSSYPLNLGGRINLLYCLFWGIAAVVWMKILYPKVSGLIEKVPMKPGKIITWILVVFMIINMTVSGLALIRSTERANNVPAEAKWQQIMDERFDDERLARIYPNMIQTK